VDVAGVIGLAVFALAAVVGLVLLCLRMVQRGAWAYAPLLVVFIVVPVAVWRVR
jgi:hypothetical protein